MAIVPLYAGVVRHVTPSYIAFQPAYYPTLPAFLGLALPLQTYPTITAPMLPFEWTEPSQHYRFVNAAYNPGSFWIWPPDR